MNGPRHLAGEALVQALLAARRACLTATLDLTDAQWRVPYHPGIQPTAWDLAHVGWFAEFWLLRGPHRLGVDGHVQAAGPGRFFPDDAVWDSARIGHRARWKVELPPREELLPRLDAQLEACVAGARSAPQTDEGLYHARFAVFHELMHVEALAWTRATLALPPPPGLALPRFPPRPPVAHPGGEFRIGVRPGEPGFAFDNERPGRRVVLAPFAIDATPVTNGDFLRFVEAGGYDRAEWWPGPAGAFRQRAALSHPERWRRGEHGWEQRWFHRWIPLDPAEPVIHVAAWEAEAWCRWAGRRLPSAAEWEVAAPRFAWGHGVWEWTADPFAPYPGFQPAPYTTYSAPWFHWQREMRGGACATHALMHDHRYRNFFLPERTDVFAGFRSVAG